MFRGRRPRAPRGRRTVPGPGPGCERRWREIGALNQVSVRKVRLSNSSADDYRTLRSRGLGSGFGMSRTAFEPHGSAPARRGGPRRNLGTAFQAANRVRGGFGAPSVRHRSPCSSPRGPGEVPAGRFRCLGTQPGWARNIAYNLVDFRTTGAGSGGAGPRQRDQSARPRGSPVHGSANLGRGSNARVSNTTRGLESPSHPSRHAPQDSIPVAKGSGTREPPSIRPGDHVKTPPCRNPTLSRNPTVSR